MKKDTIKTMVKIVLTVVFLYVVYRKINVRDTAAILCSYPVSYMVLVILITFASYFVGAVSLYAVYAKRNPVQIYGVILKSQFYAMFLPGQLLGESVKILMLSADGSSVNECMSAVVIDKFLNFIALAVIGLGGLILSPNINDPVLEKYLLAGLLLILLAFFILKNEKVMRFCWGKARSVIKSRKIAEKGQLYVDTWIGYANRDRRLLVSGVCGFVYQFIIVWTQYIVGRGFGLTVSYFDYCWINALLTVILFLPISIGGLGIKEVSLIGLMGLLGVGSEIAVGVSVMLLLVNIVVAAFGGLLILTGHGSPHRGDPGGEREGADNEYTGFKL